VHSFLSRITLSILSSARSTISVPKLAIRLLSFMRTVAAPRPPRAYSVFRTTIGSLPCMMTLPARISLAIFIASCLELGLWPPDALAGGPQAGRRAVPMHVLRRGCAAHVGDTSDARTSGPGQDIDLPRPLCAKPQIVSGLRDEAEKRRQGAAICYCRRTAQPWCRVTDHLSVCAGHRSASRRCIACQYARYGLRDAPCAALRWLRAAYDI